MFNLVSLITTVGYVGILGIVFAESGLLIGVFFPGDSMLFTAGFLSSQGYLNVPILCLLSFLGAVLGDSTGYWLGKRFGPAVFSRKDSLFFDPEHIGRARAFYDRHGPKTIILARFVPVIRTLAPTLAGVGNMRYTTFLSYNVIGGLVWGVGVPLAGFFLGSTVPGVDRYIVPIVALIILSSVFPGLVHFIRDPEYRAHMLALLKRLLKR